MFIERLTLKNFKSFGGVHELPFAPGFTAIVGPNGSGKSNILDGLRWALGENASGRLRVARQADLLFQGSAGMSEAETAEVTVHLAGGDERAVMRRSLSPGGSELTLDGARSRLQDLVAFKERVGLGGDRFAFIGQGEVTSAIVQRPKERRLQLEELFGVDRYRRRRDEAARELEEAGGELLRLRTLMGELSSRRDEVTPEAARARRARELETRRDELGAALYHLRRYAEEGRRAELERELGELSAASVRAAWWRSAWDGALTALRRQGDGYLKRRTELQAESDDLIPRLESLRRDEVECESAARESRFALSRLAEERERLTARKAESDEARTAAAVRMAGLERESAAASARAVELEDLVRRTGEAGRDRERRASELGERRASCLEVLVDARGRLTGLGDAGADLELRCGELERHREELMVAVTKADRTLETMEDDLEARVEASRDAGLRAQELSMRAVGLRRAVASLEAELDGARNAASGGVYPKPVQMILSALSLGKLSITVLPVAEAFDCDERLSVALEAYLGGRQSWLLTENTVQASQGIELLKARTGGRATFLPLERCRPHRGDLPTGRGVVGRGSDLVTALPKWKPAIDHLLGDLLVVEDYEIGAALSRGARFPVVTLAGEVFSPGGAVSGGKNARGGAISARRLIEDLESRLTTARADLTKTGNEMGAAETTERAAGAALAECKRALTEAREAFEAKQRDLRAATAEVQDLRDRIERAEERRADWERRIAETEGRLATLEAELAGLATGGPTDDPAAGLPEARSAAALARERAESARRELESALSVCLSLESDLVRLAADGRTAEARLAEAETGLAEQKTRRAQLEAQETDLRHRLSELERSGAAAGAKTERLVNRAARAASRHDDLRERQATTRGELDRCAARLEEMTGAFEAKWPYPVDFAPGDSSRDKVEGGLKYCERALHELGTVNYGAVDEEASLTDRLAFLGEQTSDVERGMAELRTVIATADRQASTLFSSAMTAIDRRFDSLFGRLFGGGEAHLTWQGEADVWDAGVEITARPPGKKTLYLAQLSGGEQSLTALALLFAAMETAGAPLAVLDEVDAALDEVNLSRFADLATEYATRVQLIIMTHRRQTMERADTMFGVTMSEPGLSQIVSVRTDQWA